MRNVPHTAKEIELLLNGVLTLWILEDIFQDVCCPISSNLQNIHEETRNFSRLGEVDNFCDKRERKASQARNVLPEF